jgi:hypothetical protein
MIERREREKERYKERYREGGRHKREREVKDAQSKPNLSPNADPKLCEWFSGEFLLKGRGTRTVPSLRGKFS